MRFLEQNTLLNFLRCIVNSLQREVSRKEAMDYSIISPVRDAIYMTHSRICKSGLLK